jgi:hypothetical protein
MGKVFVVFILYSFLSALLRLESKLIVEGLAACRTPVSVIRGIFRVRNVRTRKIRYEPGKFVTNSENSLRTNEFSEFVTYERGKFVTNPENSLRTRKIRYELGKFPLITLASLHAATISLDSSLKRAERNKYKMKTTITFPICYLLIYGNYARKPLFQHE